jgi:hypothetical protein
MASLGIWPGRFKVLTPELKPYMDLVHAARAVGLSLARVQERRAWDADAGLIRQVANTFERFSDPLASAVWDFDTTGAHAFTSPEGFYLMDESALGGSYLSDSLKTLSNAVDSNNYSHEVIDLAAKLSKAFLQLAERTVEKAAAKQKQAPIWLSQTA